jgi:hypothetical protein
MTENKTRRDLEKRLNLFVDEISKVCKKYNISIVLENPYVSLTFKKYNEKDLELLMDFDIDPSLCDYED